MARPGWSLSLEVGWGGARMLANALIFLAIFTNKIQLSDFFFSPKGRMPEGTCLVLVMLVNCRNINILDDKVMETKGWKLSDPYSLQHTPLGRACGLWLFKRKKRGKPRKTHEKWLFCSVGFQGGVSVLCLQGPKAATGLFLEGVCTASGEHPCSKANW